LLRKYAPTPDAGLSPRNAPIGINQFFLNTAFFQNFNFVRFY
jgi:hypothetical protein